MGKSSKAKVETKDEFQQHLETLCNAVHQNNYETHTPLNPYLDSLFDNITCMSDKAMMRSVVNDRLHKIKTEERSMTADIREYLKTCDISEKNFIRSLDIRSESRSNSDDEAAMGKKWINHQLFFLHNHFFFRQCKPNDNLNHCRFST